MCLMRGSGRHHFSPTVRPPPTSILTIRPRGGHSGSFRGERSEERRQRQHRIAGFASRFASVRTSTPPTSLARCPLHRSSTTTPPKAKRPTTRPTALQRISKIGFNSGVYCCKRLLISFLAASPKRPRPIRRAVEGSGTRFQPAATGSKPVPVKLVRAS